MVIQPPTISYEDLNTTEEYGYDSEKDADTANCRAIFCQFKIEKN